MSRNKYEAIKAIQDSLYKLDKLKILIGMLKSNINFIKRDLNDSAFDDDYHVDYYKSKINRIYTDVVEIQDKTDVIWNRLVKELADE